MVMCQEEYRGRMPWVERLLDGRKTVEMGHCVQRATVDFMITWSPDRTRCFVMAIFIKTILTKENLPHIPLHFVCSRS